MGSESHGISEVSRKYMTQGILIPKIGYGESLNVAIATGIILSQLSK
jgi:RNA methyltransferase, TrmH family